jgi:transcriptional regulator with XRE-family HTH domain
MEYDEFEKRVKLAYRFRQVCSLLGLSASEVAERLGMSKAWGSMFLKNKITCVQPKTYEAMRAALVDLELELRNHKDQIKQFVKKFNREVSK